MLDFVAAIWLIVRQSERMFKPPLFHGCALSDWAESALL